MRGKVHPNGGHRRSVMIYGKRIRAYQLNARAHYGPKPSAKHTAGHADPERPDDDSAAAISGWESPEEQAANRTEVAARNGKGVASRPIGSRCKWTVHKNAAAALTWVKERTDCTSSTSSASLISKAVQGKRRSAYGFEWCRPESEVEADRGTTSERLFFSLRDCHDSPMVFLTHEKVKQPADSLFCLGGAWKDITLGGKAAKPYARCSTRGQFRNSDDPMIYTPVR